MASGPTFDADGNLVAASFSFSPPCGLTELHLHIDGSLRKSTFVELWNALPEGDRAGDSSMYDKDSCGNKPRTFACEQDVVDQLCPKPGWSLAQYLSSFPTLLCVLQTAEALERVTFEICEDLHTCGVRYAELRYCPSLHRQKGLGDDAIVAAVADGLRRAAAAFPGARFYQIVTALRDLGPAEALVMTQLAVRAGKQQLVCAVDLAGNEFAHPPEKFVEAFDHAHAHGMAVTIHAGEGRGPHAAQAEQNVRNSVELLHARRIGHGVAARHDEGTLAFLKERGIAIEICPTSNEQTGSIDKIDDHPARQFFDAGVCICPGADNAMLSQTDTAREYNLLRMMLGFSGEEMGEIALRARKAGFVQPGDGEQGGGGGGGEIFGSTGAVVGGNCLDSTNTATET